MNLKDECIYYFRRLIRGKALDSIRNKTKYSQFDTHKCIFVHIPKTAGMSVSNSLFGMRISHRTALSYQVLYGKQKFNNYFKFTFVRNPFTRLISAYEFVKAGGYGGPGDQEIVATVRRYKSFEDFVMNYLSRETAVRQFRMQYEFICDSKDHLMVDFMGRFENIEQDYEYIRKKIGNGEPLKKINVTKSKKDSLDEYYTSNDVIQKVVSVYNKDFELLGYSKELPVTANN